MKSAQKKSIECIFNYGSFSRDNKDEYFQNACFVNDAVDDLKKYNELHF